MRQTIPLLEDPFGSVREEANIVFFQVWCFFFCGLGMVYLWSGYGVYLWGRKCKL